MNALLRGGMHELCPLCGSRVVKPQPKETAWRGDEGLEFAICVGCLTKHGMLPAAGVETSGNTEVEDS